MEIIFKLLLKKIIFLLIIFISIIALFLWANNLLMMKLTSAIEERENILRIINEQTQKEIIKGRILQKIREIEGKYKINFNQFKKELFSQLQLSDQDVKNLIISLAKKENLILKEEDNEDIPKTFIFSLTGNFDDLKKLENILITNKIKAKINSVRVLRQGDNYLFKVEILIL